MGHVCTAFSTKTYGTEGVYYYLRSFKYYIRIVLDFPRATMDHELRRGWWSRRGFIKMAPQVDGVLV
jgi:hypothetical protein